MEELVSQKAEPRNRSEQEIAGYREVLATIHESYEYITPRPNIILQLHCDLYSYSQGNFIPVPTFQTAEAIDELWAHFFKAGEKNLLENLF